MRADPVRVLLVEDKPVAIRVYREMLESAELPGFQVAVANSLAEALRCLVEADFDAILLDLTLGDSDGLETFQRVQQIAPDLPVVVLTGRDDLRVAVQALAWGAQDYLVKGAQSPDVVRRALLYAVERRRLLNEQAAYLRRLQVSEARFRTIFETANIGLGLLDGEGRFLEANPAMVRILGGGADPSALRLGEVIHPEERELVWQLFEELMEGERGHFRTECRLMRGGEGSVWVQLTVALVRDPAGWPEYAVAMAVDISELRRTEEALWHREVQLRHAQRLEALGSLAGGVAHDFNNLLTGVLGQASLLRECADREELHHIAEVIEKAAGRAAELTAKLLGFARRGKHQHIPVDIHQTLREVSELIGRTFPKNISVVERFEAPLAHVMGDPNQLQQVFLNLALNARDAMPRGGSLTFRTEVLEGGPSSGGRAGDLLVVQVVDTGRGIHPELKERIFEPFFTTKEPGQGSGMGLAMVYGIVQNHGGTVEVESALDQGATFTVRLPLTDRRGAPSPVKVKGAVRGQGRILLVDDEELVRLTARRMLEHLGYQVITAADGRQAVERFREVGPEVDLVILDMVTPEMGGVECFRQLKALRPDVRVVLSTGYGRDRAVQEALDEGARGFLQKPYLLSSLAEVVAAALSG